MRNSTITAILRDKILKATTIFSRLIMASVITVWPNARRKEIICKRVYWDEGIVCLST